MQPILLTVHEIFSSVQALQWRMIALEKSALGRHQQPSMDPWTTSLRQHPNRAPMPDLSPPTPDSEARLRKLEFAIKSLEKCIIGDGIRIKNFLFQSREDLQIWLKSHLPNYRFGLFLDAVSIFDFLAQSHTDDQANMSHLYASQKNGFETTYKSTVLSSMKNLFPNLFGKGGADGMDTSKLLPGLADADKWNSSMVTGLQLQVERELPNVDEELQNAISITFKDYPEARELDLELLYRIQENCT